MSTNQEDKSINNSTTQRGTNEMNANDAQSHEKPKPNEKPKDLKADVQAGMVAEIKNLYQGKKDSHGRRPWVEEYPDNLDEPVENEKNARYALLVCNVKCHDGRRKLRIESIIIQSPLLRDALGNVLDNYPGVTTGLQRMTLEPPFRPFVHRWAKLREALERERDPTTKDHLQLLHDILHEELADDINARDDMIAHDVISFAEIWMLFEPGCLVYSKKLGQPSIFHLKDGSFGRPGFTLDCKHVDWSGEHFGYGYTKLLVEPFAGTAPIAELSAMPLQFHPQKESMTKQLIQRGKDFARLSGYHYKMYEGIGIGRSFCGSVAYNINSRIIVDTYAWNRFQPNDQVNVEKIETSGGTHDYPVSDDSEDYGFDSDEEDEKLANVNALLEKPRPEMAKQHLTEEQLMLCAPTLKGYSLKDKKWLTFFIHNVKEIKLNEHAFSRLVLPEEQKELILALTESQRLNEGGFKDVIEGKGMGMIMLLSGPPGVGKTLTAESVAENMRAPLYTMSAGDLGTSSDAVESNLSRVLEMCTKWKAVLLLDEADVFLEKRSAHDLERNKLVSIFLRILEYYEGILFLTTNRVDNIDAAFQSRIHISLDYPELTPASRRHVWRNLLAGATQAHAIGDAEVERLATHVMNGREIKNVLKTAQLLANRKGKPLSFEHVQAVLSIEQRYQRLE